MTQAPATDPTPSIYRTEAGMILRVLETEDGALRVEVLREGAWVEGRIGMVGLRLAPSTQRLTLRESSALPE